MILINGMQRLAGLLIKRKVMANKRTEAFFDPTVIL